MEVEAMLRHFIAQLHNQDYLDSRPQLLLHFPHSRHQNNFNGCLDGGSVEDYYTLIMAKERSEESFEPSKPKRPRKDRTREAKSPEKSKRKSTESEAVMEQELWKDFPEDLFEAVIARLPVATFFRSRSVCHKWNSLLASGSFLSQCSEVARERTTEIKPWLYTVTTAQENFLYDLSLKKWHHFPAKTVLIPTASAAGLVCFHDPARRSFNVSNPLTRASRELPARSPKAWARMEIGAIGMASSPSSNGGYEIVWLGCNGEYEVYRSGSGTWARAGNVRGKVSVPVCLNLGSQAVCGEGAVYFMRGSPEGVVEYEVASGDWREYAVPCPGGGVTDRGLAGLGEGKGVGMVGLVTRNAATCAVVWELQRMTLLWKEVDRMPNVWCLDLYGKHVRMTCLGNQAGLIVLSLKSRHANRLVAYDVAQRHWLKLAPPLGRKKHWIACATAFQPSLTANP